MRAARERYGTIFKAIAFTIFNILFSLECIFVQKPHNMPTASIISCSRPDGRHPQSATKGESRGAKPGCFPPPENTLMRSRKETIFWSSISLVLLCFKGMKSFQSQISKINSIYSPLKNSMLTVKSCGKEIIKASKYFWHLRHFPCHVIHEAQSCWNLQASKWQYKRHQQKFASLNTNLQQT